MERHPMESDRAAGILGPGKLRQCREAGHVLVKREALDNYETALIEAEQCIEHLWERMGYDANKGVPTSLETIRAELDALNSTPETTGAT